jgi:hypothetical protein
MSWVKVGGGDDVPVFVFDSVKNKTLEGVYVKTESNVGRNHSNMYYFEGKDGKQIKIWGNTVLDSRFKNLAPGELVKVEYLGLAKGAKSGKNFHNFEVFRDEPEVV